MTGLPESKVKGKILVVDDEERICEAVKRGLERTGYQVETSLDAMDALEKIHKGSWDMVICDIRMPEMDGMSLLDRIKEYDSNILVVMITGYASIESAVEAVKKGAQEYIPKPFSPEKLMARMRARLKDSSRLEDVGRLTVSDLTLDTKTHEVTRNGKLIVLTKTEYNLLEYFLRNIGRVLTRDNILSQVWSYSPEVETRTVDVYVGYLRRKIDRLFRKKLIRSVRGFGYVMKID